jgi:5-formyltetrahydrofolate cyclo-ligase
MDASVHKKTLRADLRQRLCAIDPAAHAARSTAAEQLLVATPEFRKAQTVMLFLPLKYEVDTKSVVLKAWQTGKTVAVPWVNYDQRHMIPVILKSLEEEMELDRFGVPTPKTAQPVPLEDLDFVIIPGLGFDHHGHRIGRGAGFYDRFLASDRFAGVTCGLVFEEQIVDQIPIQPHDRGVHMLVTDKRVLRFL